MGVRFRVEGSWVQGSLSVGLRAEGFMDSSLGIARFSERAVRELRVSGCKFRHYRVQ